MPKSGCFRNATYPRANRALVTFVALFSVHVGCNRSPSPSQSEPATPQTANSRPFQTEPLNASSASPDPPNANGDQASASSALDPGTQNETTILEISNASPAQLREAALQALELGNDDVAFELVRQAKRVAPDQTDIVFLHAMVLAVRHRFHEAIQILDQLAAKTPAAQLPVLGQTAEWLVESGQFVEAEKRYRRILEQIPDAPMVHHQLSQLLLRLGRRTEAAQSLRFLAQSGALNQEELRSLLSLGKPFPQDAETNRVLPFNRLARARQAIARDRADEALEILDPVEADDEASLEARVQSLRNEWDAVRGWASKSDTPSSTDADGWFALGSLAANDGDHRKAIECFARTLLIDQTDAEAYERFSTSLREVNQPTAADEASRRADTIRQTQQIGAKLTVGSDNRERIANLIVLLERLNRRLEVLGWQSIDLVYAADRGLITESQAEMAFTNIVQERQQFVQSGQQQLDVSFILCGLDFDLNASDTPGS